MRKNRKKKWILPLFLVLFVLVAGAVGGYFYLDSLTYKMARVEAGVAVTAGDFMKKEGQEAFFVTADGVPDRPDFSKPGERTLYVKYGFFQSKVTLIIEDTIAPIGEGVPLRKEYGQEILPDEFVKNITDATEVKATFQTQPDLEKMGMQDITVLLTDLGGNTTAVNSSLYLSPIHEEVEMEVGSDCPSLKDFIIKGEHYSTSTALDEIDMNVLSVNEIDLNIDGEDYVSVLRVVDTTAPVVEVADLQWFLGVPVDPKYFVTSLEDATEVSMKFVEMPDVESGEEQKVEMIFNDEGNNSVSKEAKISFGKDTEPPKIVGAEDLLVYLGRGVSYRKDVTVEDNCMEGLTLEVDSSQVVLTELGTYPVTYIARDYSGNETSVTVEITVEDRCYDEEAVNEKASEVLAQILTEDMTNHDKVKAIFNYVISHVAYIGDSDKESWVKAAYEGFTSGKGDCYTYACVTKALLNNAGIINMDIEKIPTRSRHYWNLVDLEDGHGWYHLDTTPRKDHPTIFLWDEATLMEYSARHYRSHNYDHDLYPVVP